MNGKKEIEDWEIYISNVEVIPTLEIFNKRSINENGKPEHWIPVDERELRYMHRIILEKFIKKTYRQSTFYTEEFTRVSKIFSDRIAEVLNKLDNGG